MVAFNRDKLKRLIHYVAYRRVDRPEVLDAVKMNKALWYSDQSAYLSTGVPITGDKYIKKAMGPVSSSLKPVVDELESEKLIALRHLESEPINYLALTTPDTSIFSGEEMRMIEDAIELVCDQHTSESISQKSHDIVWELAQLNEEIPYHAIHGGRLDEVDSDDLEWAQGELVKG